MIRACAARSRGLGFRSSTHVKSWAWPHLRRARDGKKEGTQPPFWPLCAPIRTNVHACTLKREEEREGRKERRGGGREDISLKVNRGERVSVTTSCFHPPALQACNVLHGWSMPAWGKHDYSLPAHWRLSFHHLSPSERKFSAHRALTQ